MKQINLKNLKIFQPVGKSDNVIETTFEDVPLDPVPASSEDVPSDPVSFYTPNEIVEYVFSLVPPVGGLSYKDQLEIAVMKQRSIISTLQSDIETYQENIANLNKRITELQNELQWI